MKKAIKLLSDDSRRFHVENAELKLTRIPKRFHSGNDCELGILETPLGKVVVNVAERNRKYGSSCSCGNFIIFTGDKQRQTLSVPCEECTKGLQLVECEAFFGRLSIKPGDGSYTSNDFIAGYGDEIIRFYRGNIEEITLDEKQVHKDLEWIGFDAKI